MVHQGMMKLTQCKIPTGKTSIPIGSYVATGTLLGILDSEVLQ